MKNFRIGASAHLVIGLLSLGALSCKDAAAVQEKLCCPEFKVGADLRSLAYDITTADQRATFAAFMQAAADFAGASAAVADDVAGLCQSLAEDLGAAADAVTEKDPAKRATAWCNLAVTQIKSAIAGGTIKVVAQAPSCSFSASARASCEASCTSNVSCMAELGDLKVRCEPGHLSGKCEAMCSGYCEGSADVAVSCQGTCSGSCQGTCMGTCIDKEADGTTCRGHCEGMCMGHCRGSCQIAASVQVMCEADCSGSCTVDFKAPHCTAELKPPSASCMGSVDCQASCQASASVKADCSPGSITIEANAAIKPATVASLKLHLPLLLTITNARGDILSANARALLSVSGKLAGMASGLSIKAGACVIPAGAAVETAVANLATSVAAAKSVSAAVGL